MRNGDNLEDYKHIYFLQTYTGSVLSRLVKKMSTAKYSHISIGFDDKLQKFYSFGRKHPYNPFWAGFVEENLVDGVYQRFANTRFALYRLKVSDEDYKLLLASVHEFEKQKKLYRFNLLGMVTAKVGYSFDREKSFFCSQFVATVLEESGLELLEKQAGLTHPMDFSNIEGVELMYEGILNELVPLPIIDESNERNSSSIFKPFVKI